MGNTKTREEQLQEEFKQALEEGGPIVLVRKIASLEDELAKTGDALDLAVKERDAAAKRADEAETDHSSALRRANERADTAEKERDAAVARADKAEKGEKSAKAQVTKASAPAKPRKLGPIADSPASADVFKAISEAEEVEIAFSDGARELVGLTPRKVSGDAWRQHPNGLMLTKSIEIEGPALSKSLTIDGYALLIDGKQIAYSRRSSPLQIAPGQRVDLTDDIIF